MSIPSYGLRVASCELVARRDSVTRNSQLAIRNRQQGLTLVELIVFIVIVSIGIVGILAALNVSTQHSADPVVRKQVLAIAESLLEEIELMPFTFCDPQDANVLTATSSAGCVSTPQTFGPPPSPATETRYSATDPFDNVGDYGGFSMSPIKDITGTDVGGLSGYSASVSIAPPAGALSGVPASEIAVISVSVTGPGNESITLEGYRVRYAPNSTQ